MSRPRMGGAASWLWAARRYGGGVSAGGTTFAGLRVCVASGRLGATAPLAVARSIVAVSGVRGAAVRWVHSSEPWCRCCRGEHWY